MPMLNRQETFNALKAKPVDVFIIGGGILGAGIARDAALRKLRVGLVEQNDLASGTSSRSSGLIHGGLRYLGQGHFKLVREASKEKTILNKVAPHLVHPITFLFPAYRDTAYPKWKLALGVKLYDWFTNSDAFIESATYTKAETLEEAPFLKQNKLQGAVSYSDGQTHDSRLVLDTLLSAQNQGAKICPQTTFISADFDGTLWNIHLKDTETGEEFSIHSHSIINASGPWMGQQKQSDIAIRPTKGIHLIFHHKNFPISSALVLPAGKRILFAIPWGSRVILGTTDTDYAGDLENPTVEQSDIDYLLEKTNACFDDLELTQDHVISAWAGIRPLIDEKQGSESDISRKHKIKHQKHGWYDIAGGKLTSYRLIAEQTVDKVLDHLKMRSRPCTTDKKLLLKPVEIKVSTTLPPPVDMKLVRYFCREEWALHLSDVMERRTSWAQYGSCTDADVQRIAETMAEELNWSAEEKEAELAAYRNSRPYLSANH